MLDWRQRLSVISSRRLDVAWSLVLLLLAIATTQITRAQTSTAVVTTAVELQNAIRQGAQDVVVASHLDARLIQSSTAFLVRSGLRTLQGACDGAVPEALASEFQEVDLIPLKPGQCLIVASERLFEIRTAGPHLQIGMDNLYLRMQRFDKVFGQDLMAVNGASVWLTNMTLQGNGPEAAAQALRLNRNALIRVSDSTILDWNGTEGSVAVIENNSSLSIDACSLQDITNTANRSAIYARTILALTPSTAAVTGSTLTRTVEPFFGRLKRDSAVFYSDGGLQVLDADFEPVPALRAAELPPLRSTPLLPAAGNPILAAVAPAEPPAAVAIPPDPAAAAPPPPDGAPLPPPDLALPVESSPVPEIPTPASDSGPNALVVVGAAIACAVALALLLGAAILLKRKRPKSAVPPPPPPPQAADPAAVPPANGAAPPAAPPPAAPDYYGPWLPYGDDQPYTPQPHPDAPYAHPGAGPPYAAGAWASLSPRGTNVGSAAMGLPQGSGSQPGAGTPTWQTPSHGSNPWADEASSSPLDDLEAALDAMHSTQTPFYHRYKMLSSMDRRVDGQGLVQFASIINTQSETVAVKFYTHRPAFDAERQLYGDSQLKAMMPATLAIEDNAQGEWRAPSGYVLPPFVIIERGQSLDEFVAANASSDFITAVQVLFHSVKALHELHRAGYAHRDLKPSNILRRPRQHSWTLIDFGCAAQIGTTAPLTSSLEYAPPEVARAIGAGVRTIHVDAAADVWAIGVIGYELLTGEHAFPSAAAQPQPDDGPDRVVMDALLGRAPLPWEPGAPGAQERLQMMRRLKRSLLRCLERDARKRPTTAALLASWGRIFDDFATQGTNASAGAGAGVAPR